MVWDFAEANPLGNSGGSFEKTFDFGNSPAIGGGLGFLGSGSQRQLEALRLARYLATSFKLLCLASEEVVGHATCLFTLLLGTSLLTILSRTIGVIHADLTASECCTAAQPSPPIRIVIFYLTAHLDVIVPFP